MPDGVFQIDLNEKFPRLARPPIAEAVIHWTARTRRPFHPEQLQKSLTEKLSGYPKIVPVKRIGFVAEISSDTDSTFSKGDKGFHGLRLTSADGTSIVQFLKDGLVFSRTKPYQHWEPFTSAALQAWQSFVEIADPVDVQRLGVRFINHIAAASPENLQEYLRDPPTCPSNLPLKEFVYQSKFAVPARPLAVRVIKIMQPPELQQSSGLFLDIDVFSTNSVPSDQGEIEKLLSEMRWLKNKVFFNLITETAKNSFMDVSV